MGLTVADVVELPKKKEYDLRGPQFYIRQAQVEGYNQCLSEISSLKLSPKKVVGMVEIDAKLLEELLVKHLFIHYKQAQGLLRDKYQTGQIMGFKSCLSSIISNKSKILSVKGKHD